MKNVPVLPTENSEFRHSNEGGTGKNGKTKLTTTNRLLTLDTLLIQICYLFNFLNNSVKSQIVFPNPLVYHRDTTGTQNYLSCSLDSRELSGTDFVKPM